MLTKNIIQQEFYSNINREINDTVYSINNRFIEEKGDIENYLTGIIAKTDGPHIELVNAGHPNPIIYNSKENKYSVLARDPSSVGAIGIKYLPSVYIKQEFEFEQNDELIFYTDGLLECKNSKGDLFGIERLLEVLNKHASTTPQKKVEIIVNELKKFGSETPQTDDMTIIILKKK